MGGDRGSVAGSGCSRRHRRATRILLSLGGLWVTAGGFAGPLQLDALSTWPWNQGWFVFSADPGWEYHLELEGVFSDGRRAEIDPSPWFQVRATALGDRLQEIPRDRETLASLATYVCTRVNQHAPQERRLSRLSIVERAYLRARGRRLRISDVPEPAKTRHVWIDGQRCPEGS
jgi:hypothetical protein